MILFNSIYISFGVKKTFILVLDYLTKMVQIYETDNFIVESKDKPFVSREEGGHVQIKIKDETITDRTKIMPKMAIELMRLTMIVGEALEKGMKNRGVDIVKVNYQDMGNWAYKSGKKPCLHVHILGRASDAKIQVFPEAVQLPDRGTGFYDKFEPLNEEDLKEIQKQIEFVLKKEKYNEARWGL